MKSALLLGLLIATPASADRRADAVIDKAIAAMGGRTPIHAITSLVMRGFHYEGSYHQELAGTTPSNAVMVRMRPNARMVGCRPGIAPCDGKWGRIVETFDGRQGWELNWPRQRLVHTVNKAARAQRCGAEFDPLFVDYKARGFTATYRGEQTLLGRKALAVEIVQPDCPAQTYYFDPTTYRLVMQRAALPVHARGAAIDTVQVVRETMVVAGVTFTSRAEEVALDDGHVLGGGGWTSIVANSVTDPALFAAPEVHPQGATAVVLHMLDAAAASPDPVRVMALYDTFRATPEGQAADSFYDLNWLGYELLKVDDYPVALAVFQRLVADHPDKADAYDSLGDAWLQQGDEARARAAFDKALALDPTLVEAARKRRSLDTL
jgi:hypothetical protein